MPKARLYTIGNQSRSYKQWCEILGDTMPSNARLWTLMNKQGMSFIEAITYVVPQTIYIGEQYGRLEVISNPYHNKRRTCCKVKCSCGTVKEVVAAAMKSGATQSCGCLIKETQKKRNTTHGLYKHPLYHTWIGMNQRCNNPDATDYNIYGGAGVYVCPEWHRDNKEGLANFVRDMFPTWKEGYQLDKDIKAIPGRPKCYSKDTCVWITPADNCRANSQTKLTVDQVKKIKQRLTTGLETLIDIAKDFNVSERTIKDIKEEKTWKNVTL